MSNLAKASRHQTWKKYLTWIAFNICELASLCTFAVLNSFGKNINHLTLTLTGASLSRDCELKPPQTSSLCGLIQYCTSMEVTMWTRLLSVSRNVSRWRRVKCFAMLPRVRAVNLWKGDQGYLRWTCAFAMFCFSVLKTQLNFYCVCLRNGK